MEVPFHKVRFGEEEVAAMYSELAANWLSPRGPRLADFGAKWASVVGKKYGWPVSSGTGALQLALMGLEIGPGHKVAVSAYSCNPSAYPILAVGAEPVFVDIEPIMYGLDPKKLDETLKSQKIDAVIVVHLYGASCLPEVIDVCRYHGILVIEDACECSGARYWKHESTVVGREGDVSCFSFRGDKILTTLGTGGAFCTDDPVVFERMKLQSDLGLWNNLKMGRYRDTVYGMNYEISNPAAAFGLAQIDRMYEILNDRRRAADEWIRALVRQGGQEMEVMPTYGGHSWYQFPIRFTRLKSPEDLDGLGLDLIVQGVPFIPPFWPLYKQRPLQKFAVHCPETEKAASQVLLFPCYPDLTAPEIGWMAGVIISTYEKHGLELVRR